MSVAALNFIVFSLALTPKTNGCLIPNKVPKKMPKNQKAKTKIQRANGTKSRKDREKGD